MAEELVNVDITKPVTVSFIDIPPGWRKVRHGNVRGEDLAWNLDIGKWESLSSIPCGYLPKEYGTCHSFYAVIRKSRFWFLFSRKLQLPPGLHPHKPACATCTR